TFTGKFRGTHEQEHHLHESPSAMTIPLIILAVLSVIGGFVGIPEALIAGGDKLSAFLAPVIAPGEAHHISHQTEYLLMGLSAALVLAAIDFAWTKDRNYKVEEVKGVSKVVENKWYVDELYDTIVVTPVDAVGGFQANVFDRLVVDGIENDIARLVNY